jgi:hypothetical protein
MQDPIKAGDGAQTVCPSDTDIGTFEAAAPAAKRATRDDIISGCVDAVDRKYQAFKANLQQETVTTNLLVDLIALGLSSGATVATGAAATDLSAGATATIGAGTAINKDMFYQQTLPAVESSMDANRDTILTRIVQSEQADPNATSYTLASARSDIAAYQAAGNIYIAISSLTTTANKSASAAKDELQSVKAAYTAQILPSPVYARLKALRDQIYGLVQPAGTAELQNIASALGLPPNPDFNALRNAVVLEIVKRVTSVSVTDTVGAMNQLSITLKPYTGRDF